MKRYLLFVVIGVVTSCAAAQDRFYLEDFAIAPGQSRTVSLLLDNETDYTAFQCDIYLPEGLSANEDSFTLTDRKNSNHTLSVSKFPGDVYRLISYSLNLKTYSGNSGALVTFDITANEDFSGPVVLELRNVLFTTEAGVEVPFYDEECTVTRSIKGDANDDGMVSIKDVTTLIDYLLSGDEVNINLFNADVNGDGMVTIKDVTLLIDYLLSGQWSN
jgi:hypothetical protein